MRAVVIAGFLLAYAGAAWAQSLKLDFNDGKVSIDATNVPVRTVLAEWARLGGTKVVGAERIAGSALTIHLENVPEAQALEIVLRNVAGYMAAPRAAASLGASAYDRILVMPTSSAPPAPTNAGNRNNAAPPGLAGPRPGRGPFGGSPDTDPDLVAAEPEPDASDTGVNEPVFQFPQQNPFLAAQPGQVPQPGAFGQPTPFGTPLPPGSQAPVVTFGQDPNQGGVTINPNPQQPMPMLQFPGMGNPNQAPAGFGVVGAPMPGVILQPAQPTQPGQIVRPPGGD